MLSVLTSRTISHVSPLWQPTCTLETFKHANCDSFRKTGECREHLKKKHSWLEVTLPGATHATLHCVHFLQSPSLQIAYFLEMKNKNPCCSQMDHDCRHNSLMKPACMHIYSTAVRLPICQTGPETHNPTHYLPVNQLLCSLPCSIHVILSEANVQRKTNLPTLSERFYLALQSCVDFICFSLDSHTLLFEVALWQSLIQHPKHKLCLK